jgi:hypothetical protein
MYLIKVLKRKDAASVITAILVAMILLQPMGQVTAKLAAKISGLNNGQYYGYSAPGSGWQGEYLYPVVWALLQLVLLEILIRLYVLATAPRKKRG